jgi:glycosyltransferase involved in cell wall biosynthesis
MAHDMERLAVVILTYNEAKHIQRALTSIAPLGAKAFVVDGYSTDRTVALATASDAVVAQHTFVNYAKQFEWALANLPFDSEWVMRLDADEELTPELIEELLRRLPELPFDVTGVNLKRRHVFLGRWIRRGGRYPLTLMRLWRKGAARIEQRWMDEHMVLLRGKAVTFESDFLDNNLNDLTFFTDKHNKYATREAIDVLTQRYNLGAMDAGISSGDATAQATRKRWVKETIYNRLPLWFGPFGYFTFRYIFQRGFLDGREGLIYHFLQGFWYRFLVSAKVMEFERALAPHADAQAKLRELERLSGHKLTEPAPTNGDQHPAERETASGA